MNKLEKILYRKKSIEFTINKFSKGLEVYSKYLDIIKTKIEQHPIDSFERLSLEKELLENELIARNYTYGLKEQKRQYRDYVIVEYNRLMDENKDLSPIEFEDMNKKVEHLVNTSIYGKVGKMPDNKEHRLILLDYEKKINLTSALIEAIQVKIVEDDKLSDYDKAKLNKELFDLHLSKLNLEKRLNERKTYYNEEFLPVYNFDMKECDKKLSLYLSRAKAFVNSGIDIQLGFLLDEYEKKKEDREELWVFYTALRSRVASVVKELRKNKKEFSKLHNYKELCKDI